MCGAYLIDGYWCILDDSEDWEIWKEYERQKALFSSIPMSGEEYDRRIQEIVDRLGL